MRALTIRQPWASLIACGAKTIETRSWSTKYRGPLLIHAGKAAQVPEVSMRLWSPAMHGQRDRGVNDWTRLPVGAVVAVATLADVVPIVDDLAGPYVDESSIHVHADGRLTEWRHIGYPVNEWDERDRTSDFPLGDFTPGRYAWLLTDVRPLTPVPAKGRQGLWTPDAVLSSAVALQDALDDGVHL